MQNESMPNLLIKRALLTPNRIAIYFQDQTLTFHDLYECSLKVSGRLQALGIRKGQFVGVLLKNHLDTVTILFALQLLGARAVILNNRLTAAELVFQLKDSRSAFLILEESFTQTEAVITEQIDQLTTITKTKLTQIKSEEPYIQEEISLTDICTIMYTSGTTGNPKGVIQTYGNHWWSSTGSALNLGTIDSDCWLCAVPLFHISGYSILMRSVIYGMPIVLHEHFDVEQTIKDIQLKKVTIMSVVGTMLTQIVEALEDRRLPASFRCMLLGGGPAPLPLLEACVKKDIPVFQSYGMTETSSQIVTLSPEDSLQKLGSAGKPLFPSQLRIEHENGETAKAGMPGEIVVKGPNVTPGYLNRSEATEEKIRDGWLYTGDIGYLDEQGFLYVKDRRSDLIISGGENIYPAELEAILLAHPDVMDAGVTGVEDKKWGQVPVAFIVKKKDTNLSGEELQRFCMERLAKYKLPTAFYFTELLPRNAAKKLLRRKLREWV
ncbi:o-succinylbenzoate--CoA ligase [Bacillus sp. AFS076308]|uniref:o-succinylbenzoate--CoA ligase n=1 Tax=unclassified Bacillus (in: firmicutes) TaxID=185979 RepID=UPI000BF40A8F|nr:MULTISPECIES: o-succinylbenzoate--CoA ligase [unclassified Bacillus (in: firmicutes)]PFN95784.1 o-succinylbenzoate--CoA ligase [Bacillus sp. AFS076308]PGV48460.1 o-succinylbenzoate--CoA ligase [Bacillus sp. AFS037270]